ncbi:hypothetical protein [Macrococcus armenti]|uniref:hypothetical protein n=1 Tax=Macrococcus armenti TaxID=2875764 RepID=UPI001CCCBBE0|nr:hypothetical protein [Macrococcus armenti]UBH16388.1 hypothetical protein LAU44_05380 [Macrococcus armenti]UBH18744.1 hypothetical protein LAU39_05390 [Macrococcus armenti]UBH21016.1 hypothetical protein LAU40_05385 [Macrococcus armenti]
MQKVNRSLSKFWNAYKYTVRRTLAFQIFSALQIFAYIITRDEDIVMLLLFYIAFRMIQRDCVAKYVIKADKELYKDAVRASNNEIYGEY